MKTSLRKAGSAHALWLMVFRSLRQHALSTAITIFSGALASGLVMAVFSIQAQTQKAFTGGSVGFDAVLGARGSQLQLVLNSVFHLETSPGNIPWLLYESIRKDARVKFAVPYAVGDNYQGFRIVGTTSELFSPQLQPRFELHSGGRFFDAAKNEAVVGSYAAQKTGLKIGSKFNPYHGVVYDPKMKHPDEYVVVGILKPTNSPSDRVIWIPIDGFYRMSGHVLRGQGTQYIPEEGTQIPDAHKEVSAVMLQLKNPQAGFSLDQMINRQGKAATLAWPVSRVMAELFDKMGWIHRIFKLICYLVVVVVAGAILASIYNTLNERRRDFAIMRALGADRRFIFFLIVTEAAAIGGLGALFGYLVYASILILTATVVRFQTGVVLDIFWIHPSLFLTPSGVTAIAAFSGLLPAFKAYKTDIATNLTPIS